MTHHDSTSRRGPTVDREPGPQEQLRRPGEDVSGGEPRVRVHRIALQDASTATGRIADGRPQEGRRHTLAPRRPGNPEAGTATRRRRPTRRHPAAVATAPAGRTPRAVRRSPIRLDRHRGCGRRAPDGGQTRPTTRGAPGCRPRGPDSRRQRSSTTAATRCTSTASTPRWGRRTPAALPAVGLDGVHDVLLVARHGTDFAAPAAA